MTPYLAVIKDSFREALASRVLWILLALITLMLLALAPFGWEFQLTSKIRSDDIRDLSELASKLVAGGDGADSTAAGHVWSMLKPNTQSNLRELVSSKDEPRARGWSRGRLARELDELLGRRDFYKQDVWGQTPVDKEFQALAARGMDTLSEQELRRLNRLALESAFPLQFRERPTNSVLFTYLVWDAIGPLPMGEDQVDQLMRGVLAAFMNFFVGSLGVFVAILVTSPTIPNTFDAGSVSLLLSKPISRPLLFLAKFFGGCSFVVINAVYLVGGVWLLAGLRFEIWDTKLLLSIPIFLFLFVIYYSVSALAGLIWRSTVVSIVITILFWLACFSVGASKGIIDTLFIYPSRLVTLIVADDALMAVNESAEVRTWDAPTSEWKEVFAGERRMAGPPMMRSRTIVGPLYDSRHRQIVMVEPSWSQTRLFVGHQAEGWERIEAEKGPGGIRTLLTEPDGHILAVGPQGLFRLAEEIKPPKKGVEVFGFKIPLSVGIGPFRPAGIEPPEPIPGWASVAMNPQTGVVTIWDRGTVKLLRPNDDGLYQIVKTFDVTDDKRPVLLASGADTLLVARADGSIQIHDAANMDLKHQFEPQGKNQPRFALASPDGKWFAVLFHTNHLWLYDADQQTAAEAPVSGQGNISAAAFSGPDRLLVADRGSRVTEYRLPAGSVEKRYAPRLTLLEKVYRYGLMPSYTIFPKPGELGNTVNYLLTDRETVAATPNADDLTATQISYDPWAPVWSSLAFTIVVLVVSCIYMQRQEF